MLLLETRYFNFKTNPLFGIRDASKINLFYLFLLQLTWVI